MKNENKSGEHIPVLPRTAAVPGRSKVPMFRRVIYQAAGIFIPPRRDCARGRALGIFAIAVCFCAPGLRAQTTNNDMTTSYNSFSVIWQKNIFDPNRRGMRPPSPPGQHRTVNAFALVGTMSYSKGKFAFFDGTSSDYKKVLEPGATIAGYTVKEITPKNVMLAANGKELEMSVGSQMRSEGPNNWKLSTEHDLPSNSNQSTDAPAALTAPAGATPAMSEVLKRLMEQRQNETK